MMLYQGEDWFTQRLPVAKVFDTLDRMQDLCAQADEEETAETALQREILASLAFLSDDLASDLSVAEADLLPSYQNNLAQRWALFEMRAHLARIRQVTMLADDEAVEADLVFDHLGALVSSIKDGLRRLDQ